MSTQKKIWFNSKIVPDSKAKVSIWDRGFLYGDGVYETVRVYEGKIFRAEGHWKRLDNSLRGIQLKIPWSHSYLTRACLSTIRANRLKECLVRVTISRGVGKLGYDPATCKKPTLVILALPVRSDLDELWSNGVKVEIVNVRRNHQKSLNPALKTTNCLNGILAKMESLKKGAFEGVFLNLDGYLAEGTISNIFIVKNGIVKTPVLECGLLDGVTHSAAIECAKKVNVKVLETKIKPFEVYNADEVFLTSTTMELMPVVQVNGKKIGNGRPGTLTKFLHKEFRKLLKKELKIPSKSS